MPADRTCRWIAHESPYACGATPVETQLARLIFGAVDDMPVPIDLCAAHTELLRSLEAARAGDAVGRDRSAAVVVLPESPGRSRSPAFGS
jgi:hypothetical protein